MTVLSPFDEVIRDFAEAQHLLRMKKLLVYACTQQWESDPERLAQHHLHSLIETLMQIAPTLDQLKAYLDQVTQSLSKPAEYLLIANAIVQGLRKLYVKADEAPHLSDNPHLYWQVAQRLEQDPDPLRMRKLMVLICRNRWELDTSRLLAINLADLVYELHQLTQSLENVQAVFHSVVQNTSKPLQYGAIASRIIAALEILYTTSPCDDATQLRMAAPGPLNAQATLAPRLPEPYEGATHADAQSVVGHGDSQLASSPPIRPEQTQSASHQPNLNSNVEVHKTNHVAQPSSVSDQIPTLTQAELFDLRLEIMKYTVPLLAKQLLFLTLYAPAAYSSEVEVSHLATDAETWAALKNRDMDDLIEGALKHYPTLTLLTEGLQRSARLSQNAERSAPVASAIARAVKTIMVKHRPHQRPNSEPQSSQNQLPPSEPTRQVASPTVSYDADCDADLRAAGPAQPSLDSCPTPRKNSPPPSPPLLFSQQP